MFHVKHSGAGDDGAASIRDNAGRGRPACYLEPSAVAVSELHDRGSRFIGQVEPLDDASCLQERLDERRREHPAATHVVYAYAVGIPSPSSEGCSDDGEPHGTAGRPVLDAIAYADLTNTLLTVVRYFGGTKLGTGGLVRAYGESARRAIAGATVRRCVARSTFRLPVSYELYEGVKRECTREGVDILNVEFGEEVHLTISVESALVDELTSGLLDLSAGSITLRD